MTRTSPELLQSIQVIGTRSPPHGRPHLQMKTHAECDATQALLGENRRLSYAHCVAEVDQFGSGDAG